MRTQPASQPVSQPPGQPSGQPSGQPPTSPIVITSWSRSVFQPALIIANALALISAPLFVLRRFDAERPWLILLIVCLLVALEGYATTIWLLQPERRLLNHGRYRAAEALVLLVLLRLVSWGVVGNWPTAQSWIELLSNPLLLFFDGFFAAALVAVYATWYRTLNMSNVFIRLAPDAAERHYYAIPRPERIEANQPMPINREALQNNFAQQFLGGAILVLFCTAILSIDLATIETIRNPLTEGIGRLRLPPGMLVGLLLYFLTSFLLFSQARLTMMEVRWLLEDVQKSPGIGRVWTRRTALILLVIGLGAAFLPVGSTFVFSQMLSWLIYGAMWVITAVFQILAFLILALLAYLFPNRTPAEPEPYRTHASLPAPGFARTHGTCPERSHANDPGVGLLGSRHRHDRFGFFLLSAGTKHQNQFGSVPSGVAGHRRRVARPVAQGQVAGKRSPGSAANTPPERLSLQKHQPGLAIRAPQRFIAPRKSTLFLPVYSQARR
jgi:hypothetical protein